MTRKDFELIAAIIKAERANPMSETSRWLFDNLSHEFAAKLKTTNAQFNRDRFLRACGVITL